MREAEHRVPTADGTMPTYMTYPDGNGPFPTVVVYQYAGGVTDIFLDVARLITEHGYCCAVPDLYYRIGRIASDPDNSLEEAYRIRRIAVDSIAVPYRVMDDTKSMLKVLESDPLVRRGSKGTIGFCQGGFYSLEAAGVMPDTFRASIALYPTRLLDDRSDIPYNFIDQFQGEVYIGFPEFDEFAPEELVNAHRERFERECKAQWQIEVHPGTHHGYTFVNRSVYDDDATKLTWSRVFGAFERQLQ